MTDILSDNTTQASIDVGRLILRLAVAVIVLFHGVAKVTHGVAWIAGPLGAFGLPSFLSYGTYLAEVIAPVLLIVGYRVRLAALLICIDLLMAILLVLRERVFVVNAAGGGWGVELEALIALAALAIFFLGSGKYAIVRSGT